MVVTSLTELSDSAKQELVASLSAICVSGDVSAESLGAVATASGNDLSGAWASVFSTVVNMAEGGVSKFTLAPGSGGGGGGGGGAGGDAAEEVEEEKKEEEEEMDLGGGGMSMFGEEEGAGGGDY
eukprot:CAMPEP_0198290958 /NCGR_PEP_ID=MMETSP1449-20131203/8641_1 /TAXON_ID=420275 /ORGANISM="Attheya septentrionalis, Strain CCMP2084" /LENGTH=124 /DNA_ID=CAMNT_0043989529 /DNA_START=58 /DNA_END=432 /DNA_ORIENTATION=+